MSADAALHPTEQTLSSFALGKLDDASSEAVNEHLGQCPDCRKRVGAMSADSFLELVRGAQAQSKSRAGIASPVAGPSLVTGGPSSQAPPPSSSLPSDLADHSDYEIIRELGRGGMGVVYLAKNKLMGRPEVLKVVGGHLVERPGVKTSSPRTRPSG
jgi:serine/threonine protein kinase